MKMLLSEFIKKLENITRSGEHPRTALLVKMLKQNLAESGDIEFDVDDLCKHLGIKI